MKYRIFTSLLICFSCLTLLVMPACHPVEEWDNDAQGNFDALWTALDTRYCFFEEKGVDWDAVGREYRARVTPGMSQIELFDLCAEMLATLEDGHVNLISKFDTSYYKKWWTDYPQDFNLRTLQENYLGFDYSSASGLIYKELPNKTGYIYCSSFSTPISDSSLSWILARFAECDKLIIDIRNNGGGLLTNVETLVSRFISTPIVGGYIRHKTGPGHNDFSAPYEIVYNPAAPGLVRWEKPIIVITNRSCFSAANDFVAVMKSLRNVRIVGARTGGGGGMPFTSELPNGWAVRFSACPITDAEGISTENGIDPSPGCEVHASAVELAEGKDAILDFALNLRFH